MNNHIDFEMNNLRLNQFMETEKQVRSSVSYELYAICIHIGENMGQGHYTSKIKYFFQLFFFFFTVQIIIKAYAKTLLTTNGDITMIHQDRWLLAM